MSETHRPRPTPRDDGTPDATRDARIVYGESPLYSDRAAVSDADLDAYETPEVAGATGRTWASRGLLALLVGAAVWAGVYTATAPPETRAEAPAETTAEAPVAPRPAPPEARPDEARPDEALPAPPAEAPLPDGPLTPAQTADLRRERLDLRASLASYDQMIAADGPYPAGASRETLEASAERVRTRLAEVEARLE